METRNCQNCKKDFTIEPDDFSFYEKMKVPAPTWCPECRMIRRFNYRNERFLFRRLDFNTGKDTFSGFSTKSPVKTFENNFWFGDNWDSFEYGLEYNFSINFFDQYRELLKKAPIPARSVFNMINSDYCNEASESKNCYLCFNTDYIEDSAYLRKVRQVKNSFDLYEASDSELSYESITIDKCYQVFYSLECENCVDIWFSKKLRGCTNCFGCINLVNKSNCFFNEQYSKEEYAVRVKEFLLDSYVGIENIKKQVKNFWLKFPVKYNVSIRTVNSTGDRIYDSRNLKYCYYVKSSENLAYCQDVWTKTTDCYDYSVWGDGAGQMYECMTCGMGVFNLKFCFNCWEESRDLEYCMYCLGCSDCFGCAGLRKKKYCIFNKQYTKEEYFILREKIIKHMNNVTYEDKQRRVYKYGEFFPFDISPTAYNESLANDFFPLEKSLALEKGYVWFDQVNRNFFITIKAEDLPDRLADTSETIIEEIISCKKCKKAYKIIPMELQFYKRLGLPIPRLCHDCRFVERFKLVTPPRFYTRSCMCEIQEHDHKGKCQNEFETPYAPDRPEIVYCEKCYQQEVN